MPEVLEDIPDACRGKAPRREVRQVTAPDPRVGEIEARLADCRPCKSDCCGSTECQTERDAIYLLAELRKAHEALARVWDEGCTAALIYKAGKRYLAHRYMYEREVGPIPPGKLLRHTCDTAACCNPRHLIPGTDAENVQDMMRANRQAKGSRMHSAKLTEELVVEIRKIYQRGGVTGREMARRYGITQSAMSKVLQGVTWRHVPMEEA